ncbi:MAG: tetratricopeptide repeat protein [Desulfuromonadaceae bacterium]|nr:tetratricopeptide repeat protein [Desulfuromonadaceae bacterium]
MQSKINNTTVHLALLVILSVAIYANSLSVPFLFDDFVSIVNNPAISDYSALLDTEMLDDFQIVTDLKNNIKTRTFSFLTFAVNRQVGGLNPVGYHLVNVFFHAVNACLVYLLVSYLLTLAFRKSEMTIEPPNCKLLALIVSLLFVVHPIQTSAVTYITQRFTTLATLLYLSALIMYIKGRCSDSNKKAVLFFVTSFFLTALAMDTKEIAFTIPFVMTITELVFFSGRTARRLLTLAPFYLTLLIIPLTLWSMLPENTEFSKGVIETTNMMNLDKIPRASYLFTQFRVIVTYMRLLIFPVNQNFDYNYPVFHSFTEPPVLISFIFLVILLSVGFYFLVRASNSADPNNVNFRMGGFGLIWFFVTLSMTSSVIPINDVINEYRLYLPSVGFIIFVISTVSILLCSVADTLKPTLIKVCVISSVTVVCIFALSTVTRNRVYQDRLVLWQDVAQKSPGKLRPAYNLAEMYMSRNMPDSAIETLENLIRLNPTLGKPHCFLGLAFLRLNRFDAALAEYKKAQAVRNDKAEVHIGLAEAYLGLGKTALAVDSLNTAGRLEPNNPKVRQLFNLISAR